MVRSADKSSSRKTNLVFSSFIDDCYTGITNGSADDKISNYIFERICDGTYLPGSHINEHKISKELKTSIIRIRQSIERLVHIDLLERIPNKGVFLKKLSLSDLDDIYEARRLIEISAIGKLARTVTAAQLARLQKILHTLNPQNEALFLDGFYVDQKQNDSPPLRLPPNLSLPTENGDEEKQYYRLIMADVAFHMLIVQFAGNRLFEKLAEVFIPRAVLVYRLYHSMLYDPQLWQWFVEKLKKDKVELKIVTHERLYQALEARDAQLAEQLMRDHLDDSYYQKKAKIELLEHIRFMNKFLPASQLVALEA